MSLNGDSQRVDRWLWFARFFKTRTVASRLAAAGRVRINSNMGTERITKASHMIRPGDILTFPQGRRIRVVRVTALGQRRGPAAEAQSLYEDLSAAQPPATTGGSAPGIHAERPSGSGRPTKKDRRQTERLKTDTL